jgi:hypothetical protein
VSNRNYYEYADFENSLVPRKGFYYEYSSCASEDVHDELNGPVGYNYIFWVDPCQPI